MLDFGRPYGFGLEVGSKAELLLAMSIAAEAELLRSPGSVGGADAEAVQPLLVCNGYKDAEYMELVSAGNGNKKLEA